MIRRPPRSTLDRSSAASDVYKRQLIVTVSTTLVVSLLLPKNYKSSATLLVTHKGADPVTGMILPAQLSASYMATQLDVIKSTRIALMVIDQLRLDQSLSLIHISEPTRPY
mgnify:CR=1 FL=1